MMAFISYSVFAKGGPVMWLLVILGLSAVVIFVGNVSIPISILAGWVH